MSLKKSPLHILKRNLSLLIRSIKLDCVYFFMRLFWTLFGSVITVLNVIIPKYLIEAVLAKDTKAAFYILVFTLGINLINSIIESILSPRFATRKEKINVKVIDACLSKSFSLKLVNFDNAEFYDKYSIVFDNCCTIIHTALDTFLSIVSAITQISLVFSILFWMNKIVLIIMVFVILVQLLIDRRRKDLQYNYQVDVAKDNRQLNYLYRLFYVPQFMRDIRINSLKDFIFSKKKRATDALVENMGKTQKKISIITLFTSVISHIESFLISAYFVIKAYQGYILVGDFFVSINSYNSLKASISSLFSTYNSLYSNDLYINDYLYFMDIDEQNEEVVSHTKILHEIESIEFCNVSFSYPNSSFKALDGVSFKVNKGDKIAIIGSNGAGKTTIIKLLLRLYEPQDGSIKINGINISEYDIVSLRKLFSVLFQDYAIYPFSLRENITLGKNLTDQVVKDSLQKVGLSEKIKSLPLGLDTPITSQMSDCGVEFSGGESQRIALARIYASSSKFVILDEPTSNLDPYIEYELYNSLLSEFENRTVIIISHRLTFTYKMNRILYFNEGKLIEEGTHDDLLRDNGYYAKMYNLNVEKYTSARDWRNI